MQSASSREVGEWGGQGSPSPADFTMLEDAARRLQQSSPASAAGSVAGRVRTPSGLGEEGDIPNVSYSMLASAPAGSEARLTSPPLGRVPSNLSLGRDSPSVHAAAALNADSSCSSNTASSDDDDMPSVRDDGSDSPGNVDKVVPSNRKVTAKTAVSSRPSVGRGTPIAGLMSGTSTMMSSNMRELMSGSSIEAAEDVQRELRYEKGALYTFQKRSLRHSRQNWKAAPSTSNALCLPQADPSVQAMLDRLQGRHRLVPLPRKRDNATTTKKPVPLPVPQEQNHARDNATTAARPAQESPQSEVANAQNARRPLDSRTPADVPSRMVSPGSSGLHASRLYSREHQPASVSESQTSVIPSHALPPVNLSRPSSVMQLVDIVTPPSTASQLLSRNLLGLPMEFGGSLSIPSGQGASSRGLGDTSILFGAEGSSNVIGSLRPNSVMRLPPIAISTSVGCAPLDAPAARGSLLRDAESGDREGIPDVQGSPKPLHTKPPTVEWAAKHKHGARANGASGANDLASATEAYVGDPEEVLVGGGMFSVVPPTQFPVADLTPTALHVGPTNYASPLSVNGSTLHQLTEIKPTSTKKKQSSDQAKPIGALRDESTPKRLATFGLKPPLGRSSSPNTSALCEHRIDSEPTRIDTPLITAAHHNSGGERHDQLSHLSDAMQVKAKMAPKKSLVPSDDPVQRVVDVCRWGYDLRTLFLVQLARDQCSLPRFVGAVGEPLEAWVAWLQYGAPLPDRSVSGGASCVPKNNKRKKSAAEVKQEETLQRVVVLACEYVANNFFGGSLKTATGKFERLSSPQRSTRNVLASDVSPLAITDAPVVFDGECKAKLRRLLAEQCLRASDFADMFRQHLKVSSRDAQKVIQQWLIDPHTQHAGIERCAAEFLRCVDTLRDLLIDCLQWNAEERHAYEAFDALVRRILSDSVSARETTGGDAAIQDTGAILALLDDHERDDCTGPAHIQRMARYLERHRGRRASLSDGTEGRHTSDTRNARHGSKAPESVEDFCELLFLSHADVCAWLARSPTFDKSILKAVWTFVIEHHAQRPSRMKSLRALEGMYQQHINELELNEKRRRQGIVVRPHASSDVVEQSKQQKFKVQERKAPQKITQDQFILESVISRLSMLDEEDAHRAAFRGGIPATLLPTSSDGEVESHSGHHLPRWRELVPQFVAHVEQSFRQDAALLRHVVKKRAEPYHRSGLEKAVHHWRADERRPRQQSGAEVGASLLIKKDECRPLESIAAIDNQNSLTRSATIPERFTPVCQQTLESFLTIQHLSEERLPPPVAQYLRDCLQQSLR